MCLKTDREWMRQELKPYYETIQSDVPLLQQMKELSWALEQQIEHEDRKYKRFRALFYNAPIGMIITTQFGFIKDHNRMTAKILGYENRDDFKRCHMQDIIHPEDWVSPEDFKKEVTNSVTNLARITKRFLTADGSYRQLKINVQDFELKDEAGYFGYLLDT